MDQDRIPLVMAYQVLGVQPPIVLSELKSRFKVLAVKLHPDKGGDPMLFDLLKKAFLSVWDTLKHEEVKNEEVSSTMHQRVLERAQDVADRQQEQLRFHQAMHKSGRFDNHRFNKVFQDHYEADEDDAYGCEELMTSSDVPTRALSTHVQEHVSERALACGQLGSAARLSSTGYTHANRFTDLREAYTKPHEAETKVDEERMSRSLKLSAIERDRERPIERSKKEDMALQREQEFLRRQEEERQSRALMEQQRAADRYHQFVFRLE